MQFSIMIVKIELSVDNFGKLPILDAYGAQQLVKILLRLTKQGTTILCTIHQPSSQIFAMFHKVLLLADGRIGFIGSPHEAVTFFSQYVLGVLSLLIVPFSKMRIS